MTNWLNILYSWCWMFFAALFLIVCYTTESSKAHTAVWGCVIIANIYHLQELKGEKNGNAKD